MPEPLKIVLFDGEGLAEETFRLAFQQLRHVQIVDQTSSWDELRELLTGETDVAAVNLGDKQGQGLSIVQRIAETTPTCSILGVGRWTDPESIIAAMRAGCSQFVTWPIDATDLNSAMERIRTTRVAEVKTSKLICVVGSAGGSGATTVACNLAMELVHTTNRRCALVDLNLEFGDVCTVLDCSPNYSIADVCGQGAEIDRTVMTKALYNLPCNVSILARPGELERAYDVTPEGVEGALRTLSTMFSYVVVDMPRTLDALNAAAVKNADYTLIVTQLGVPFIRNATRMFDGLIRTGMPEDRVQIVLNRCNADNDRIKPEEVEAHFGQPIFAMIPNDYKRVQSALDLGHPIVADAPSSPARLAIEQLAKKLTSQADAGEAEKTASSGLLSRLWRRPAKAPA
ncbi:MAG: AAA family ATPase [Phycisphaerae bacterium]|nr:AAA family ATPase [Phycisphaerae bacterium]